MQMVIVSGVHLDRAWAGLGAPFGSALRDWSRHVLALVVEEANHRNAEILLIAGGLVDRSYALPATIDYASQLLGTFCGNVLVVPGKSDWIVSGSLYSTHKWSPNISICSASDYQPSVAAASVWVSGWTSPAGLAPPIAHGPGPRMLVRPGMAESDLDRLSIGPDDLIVTTGATVAEGVLTVPDLVHDPRQAAGFGLLIDSAELTKPAQRIDFPSPPGLSVEVDVTNETSTAELAAAIEVVLTPGTPILLRLLGTLAPGVLLPGYGGLELPPEVVLDLDPLSFATVSVDDVDRSARAEFVRAMANASIAALQQHQTTALGLAALEATVQEG